jgi:sRNA-binding protein
VGLAAVILGYSTHPDEHIVIPTLSSPYGSFLRMEAVKEDLNGASFNTLLPWAVEAKVARTQAAEEEAQAEEAQAAQAAAEAEARAAQATAEEATATRLVARSEVQQSVATTEARHAVDSLAETAGRPHATVFLKRHSHSNERV